MELLSRRLGAACFALALVACIGTSPEDKARQELGPDPSGQRNGPLHRAGFACGVCHGLSANPGFEAAGTIYSDASGAQGLAGATVTLRDASGHEVSASSNEVGNFFFVVGEGTRRGANQGQDVLTAGLQYPLSVRVSFGGQEQKMRGLIWREQSCAACHRGKVSATSNGVVFVEGTP